MKSLLVLALTTFAIPALAEKVQLTLDGAYTVCETTNDGKVSSCTFGHNQVAKTLTLDVTKQGEKGDYIVLDSASTTETMDLIHPVTNETTPTSVFLSVTRLTLDGVVRYTVEGIPVKADGTFEDDRGTFVSLKNIEALDSIHLIGKTEVVTKDGKTFVVNPMLYVTEVSFLP